MSVDTRRGQEHETHARTVSIVIPALNEEGNIRSTLDAVTNVVGELFDDYEILVVNDGSTDTTPDIVREYIRGNSRIQLISHPTPLGFGASYDDGRRRANMHHCIMVHGDNAIGRDTLYHFLSHAGEADVLCGFIANPHSRTKARQLVSAGYTRLLNILLGFNLRYYNGIQLHRSDWLRNVDLTSTGFGFQAELLVRALFDGKSHLEIPYIHTERPGGGVTKLFKIKNILSVIKTLGVLFSMRCSNAGVRRRGA